MNPTAKYTEDQWAQLGRAVVEARHLSAKELDARFAFWDAQFRGDRIRKNGKIKALKTEHWFAHSMALTYGSERAFLRLMKAEDKCQRKHR
jgi:hypothetical protein